MNRITRSLLAAVAAALCIASCVQADVRMHKLFSSEMVLQRNTAVPVYGWAAQLTLPKISLLAPIAITSASTPALPSPGRMIQE